MDYEEKYKDLVKRLNKTREEKGVYTFNSVLDVVAPELKIDESEDERIRQLLIRFVTYDMSDNYSDDFTPADCVAWLEKQGKQKPADKEYTFKAIPRLLEMIQPTDRVKSYCQKLIDNLEQEGYCTDAKIVRNCLKQMNGEKVAMATMDEQKLVWSEEDENRINNLCHFLEEYGNQYYGHLTLQNTISWLKSLRPQPKQKWSQDDNDFADDAIACVTRCYENYIDNKEFYQSLRHNTMDIKRWLIDVRKRLTPHWKPSDLQIEALESATANCAYSEYEDCLKDLIKQLKQL